ncbi:MAG: maleylpyruvate isomerase N-terminal domain-containing protein [Nocardioidaceae bacterium]
MPVTPDHVRASATELRHTLAPVIDAEWTIRAADLDWSVWDTGVHVADDLVFYAAQLIAQPIDRAGYTPFEVAMWGGSEGGADNDGLVRTIEVCAEILARVVTTAGPDDRGFHTYGVSDAEGFAAMGVVETLVHAYDMSQAFGLARRPPGELSAVVLERLFPDAPDGDPTDVLLWCCGRTALGARPRQTVWQWDGGVRR